MSRAILHIIHLCSHSYSFYSIFLLHSVFLFRIYALSPFLLSCSVCLLFSSYLSFLQFSLPLFYICIFPLYPLVSLSDSLCPRLNILFLFSISSIVFQLYIYKAPLAVKTNEMRSQCERPREKKVALKQRKEELGVNSEESVDGES